MNLHVKFAPLLTSFALLTTPLFAPSTLAGQVSFSDAWTLLQAKNNAIAAQRANVDRRRFEQHAADSLDLPTVTLGANYTRLDDDITMTGDELFGHPDFSTLPAGMLKTVLTHMMEGSSTIAHQDTITSSIRAVWPLFTGGRISAAQAIAEGKTDEAEAQLRMETQAHYEDLAKYYFSVVLAKSVLQTRKSVEKGLTKHRDFALKLEQHGQIAKVERLQAEASLDKAKVDRRKAQKDVDIAISALTQILNQTDKVLPNSDLFINDSLPPLTIFTEQTLKSYPGLALLDAKNKQASNLIKAENGRYLPEVYMYGNYSLYEDDALASEMAPEWLVGVGVSIPLIDNSGRSNKVQAAHSAVLQVKHLRMQAIQNLSVLVEKSYAEAEQAIEEVKGLASSLSLAQENLSLRSKAFNQGLSTSLEVIDAELYLASIRTQQQLASYNYLIALNRLLALSSEMDSFNQYESNAFKAINPKDKS